MPQSRLTMNVALLFFLYVVRWIPSVCFVGTVPVSQYLPGDNYLIPSAHNASFSRPTMLNNCPHQLGSYLFFFQITTNFSLHCCCCRSYVLLKTAYHFFTRARNNNNIFFTFLYGVILGILGVFLRITRVFLGITENRVHFIKALHFPFFIKEAKTLNFRRCFLPASKIVSIFR